jgi:hypothetical protein
LTVRHRAQTRASDKYFPARAILLFSPNSWIVQTMWSCIGIGTAVLLLVIILYPFWGWVSYVAR